MFLPGVEPVMIRFSLTGGNIFATVKTIDANIDMVMFLQASVCPRGGGGGVGVSASVHAVIPPLQE